MNPHSVPFEPSASTLSSSAVPFESRQRSPETQAAIDNMYSDIPISDLTSEMLQKQHDALSSDMGFYPPSSLLTEHEQFLLNSDNIDELNNSLRRSTICFQCQQDWLQIEKKRIDISHLSSLLSKRKPNYAERLVCFECNIQFESPQQRHEHQKVSRHAHNYYDKQLRLACAAAQDGSDPTGAMMQAAMQAMDFNNGFLGNPPYDGAAMGENLDLGGNNGSAGTMVIRTPENHHPFLTPSVSHLPLQQSPYGGTSNQYGGYDVSQGYGAGNSYYSNAYGPSLQLTNTQNSIPAVDERRVCFECKTKFESPQHRHQHQEQTKHARTLIEWQRKIRKVTLLTAAVSQSGLYGIGASGMSLMQQEMMTAAAIQSSNALQSNPNSVYLYDMSLAPNQATVQPQPHVTSATQLQNQQAAANAASASMARAPGVVLSERTVYTTEYSQQLHQYQPVPALGQSPSLQLPFHAQQTPIPPTSQFATSTPTKLTPFQYGAGGSNTPQQQYELQKQLAQQYSMARPSFQQSSQQQFTQPLSLSSPYGQLSGAPNIYAPNASPFQLSNQPSFQANLQIPLQPLQQSPQPQQPLTSQLPTYSSPPMQVVLPSTVTPVGPPSTELGATTIGVSATGISGGGTTRTPAPLPPALASQLQQVLQTSGGATTPSVGSVAGIDLSQVALSKLAPEAIAAILLILQQQSGVVQSPIQPSTHVLTQPLLNPASNFQQSPLQQYQVQPPSVPQAPYGLAQRPMPMQYQLQQSPFQLQQSQFLIQQQQLQQLQLQQLSALQQRHTASTQQITYPPSQFSQQPLNQQSPFQLPQFGTPSSGNAGSYIGSQLYQQGLQSFPQVTTPIMNSDGIGLVKSPSLTTQAGGGGLSTGYYAPSDSATNVFSSSNSASTGRSHGTPGIAAVTSGSNMFATFATNFNSPTTIVSPISDKTDSGSGLVATALYPTGAAPGATEALPNMFNMFQLANEKTSADSILNRH